MENFETPESAWDSESRRSPFSTVADVEDETCEACLGSGCEDCTPNVFRDVRDYDLFWTGL